MKTFACLVLFSAILAPGVVAQTKAASAAAPQPYQIQISAGVAEKLLIQKVNVACPHVEMAARVIGTVVVALEIDKDGDVLHPSVVSGAPMLRKAVLDAVRKYKYKPYLLNGKAVEVETTVSVTVNTLVDCPAD
ncbi:MAG: energy transducer TonB [Terracidiphilus sp.]